MTRPTPVTRYPPHPLTKAEARLLIETAADGSRVGVRNRAHLTVLYRAGLRCNESCAMNLADLYPLEDGCAFVRVEKPKGYDLGVMPREVGLDPISSAFLFEWVSVRGIEPGPLFRTSTGSRVDTSYFRQLLPRLAERAGIHRRVHAHALRHTFAREMYDEGIGVMEIMLALGHTSLATTQKYLRSIGATEVVHATARRKW